MVYIDTVNEESYITQIDYLEHRFKDEADYVFETVHPGNRVRKME